MVKFVLILITAILVFLGIYTYSNQTTEKSAPVPKISEKKVEVQKTEKVSVVTQEVKEKKSSVKNITAKSPKVVSKESNKVMENKTEISEGLTLESIENADVSDEKQQRMLDDMAYNESLKVTDSRKLSDEEILKIIDADLKNDPIQ